MGTLLFLLSLIVLSSAIADKNSIRDQFTSRFYERCSKYSFVQRYYDILEHPPNHFLIFEYHKNGLKNGGFGDRLGGVITAFIHAIRFNRNIYMLASNGMHKLFRPFHPKFIPNPNRPEETNQLQQVEDVYYWNRWEEWSGFRGWKKNHTAYRTDASEFEYDLSDCVDVSIDGFSEKKTKKCAMDMVSIEKMKHFPIIRMASNRAYLCRYDNRSDLPSHTAVFQALDLRPEETDYFEVAGCISRLMLWPTDHLWDLIDKAYAKHFRELLTESPEELIELIDREKHPEKYEDDDDDEETADRKIRKKLNTKEEKKRFKKLIKNNKKKLLNYVSLDILLNSTNGSPTTVNDDASEDLVPTDSRDPQITKSFTLQSNPPFQLGLHMRCGDYWSYRNLLFHTDGYHRLGCIYDEEDKTSEEIIPYTLDPTTAKRSYYLNGGNPKKLGTCANGLIQSRQNIINQRNRKKQSNRRRFQVDANSFFTFPDHDDQIADSEFENRVTYVSNHTLVFVTADNLMAEYQMKQFTNHYPTIISPQGCHIDLDQSKECYEFTTIYWFILSLSNLLITQTFSELNAPTSSFSRYAGIYGLFPDSPFRSGRYCGDKVYSTSVLSRFSQGNWYCK